MAVSYRISVYSGADVGTFMACDDNSMAGSCSLQYGLNPLQVVHAQPRIHTEGFIGIITPLAYFLITGKDLRCLNVGHQYYA